MSETFKADPIDGEHRYWIVDVLEEDKGPYPFGEATVGIADELNGGITLYLHEDSALEVLTDLRAAHDAKQSH